MNNYFSKNLTYLLDSKQISVDTILKITGHNSPSLVSMWKSGERNIITGDAIKLANYLNITIDDLINIDLSKNNNNNNYDETEVLFSKYKDILTDDDKATIKFLIEKRKKDIDNQEDNK